MKIPYGQREAFLAWYRSYSPRERQLLALLAAVVAFAAVYEGMWQPVQRGFDEARRTYSEERELLQWMQARAPTATQKTSATASGTGTSLSALLTNSAKEHNIAIKHIEMGQDGHASLTLEAVSFNYLVSWLDALESAHHVTPLSLAITKTDALGRVNATLQMQAQGS